MDLLYEKYADILLNKCLNITNETALLISSPIENIEFVRVIAKKAYEFGICDIYFDWEDSELKHDQLKYLNSSFLHHSCFWNKQIYDEYVEKNAAFLILCSGEDDLMKDIIPEKLNVSQKRLMESRRIYRKKQFNYEISWCIAAVPTKRWANKLFPDCNNSLEKLWNLLFDICLINKEKPILEWNRKIADNTKKVEFLNRLRLKELHYTNSLGTDFKIQLPPNHRWMGTSKQVDKSKKCMVNFPTEEVFTSPIRTSANGIVYNSKPLTYNGAIIDEFSLNFKDGKVINLDAKVGLPVLKEIVSAKENSNMLGEVALVDYDSPLSKPNIIFYHTLLDENTSCHLALGSAFPHCIEGGGQMTKEQLIEAGINQSDLHVDFMIGTSDLSIIGTTYQNEKIEIFKDGNFNF